MDEDKIVAYSDLLKLGIDEVLRLAKIGQQMQWISVNDRLPETTDGESEKIIVCDNEDSIITGVKYYSEDKVFADEFWGVWSIGEFTHWMPLPQPLKEGK
jgi:hypothetical protein